MNDDLEEARRLMQLVSGQATQAGPIDALTATPTVTHYPIAFMLGASDAESGDLCLPELYFVKVDFAKSYVQGHESVAGETLLSRQYKELHAVNW